MSKKTKVTIRTILAPAIIPAFLVMLMWLVFFIEYESGSNFAVYGLKPRSASGLIGILTIPFIHGSWSHLFNNSIPMLVLGWALFKVYPTLAYRTLFWIYILGGVCLWITGRPSYHIGASGIVYGLAGFLFFSGVWRREKEVAALSLLIAFVYGSMWWGVLPVDPSKSWEGHLWGGLAGFLLAFLYRKKGGPQPKVYQWEIDEQKELAFQEMLANITYEEISVKNETEPGDLPTQPDPSTSNLKIVYSYKPKKDSPKSSDSSKSNLPNDDPVQ